ncbi:hypothetical protein BD626DRAFT_402875 [Schizophyllum amplum]|uniref:Pentacotripeptide-repeat region of PRORP domain-containing protein n=1 Tax=Schizophyllum amplum TaxID=97359 RepID=A0A550CEV0_9AGAR|nr:hypothetical protein BD626DRAFT_402875 [Auriculariopsis ampla]
MSTVLPPYLVDSLLARLASPTARSGPCLRRRQVLNRCMHQAAYAVKETPNAFSYDAAVKQHTRSRRLDTGLAVRLPESRLPADATSNAKQLDTSLKVLEEAAEVEASHGDPEYTEDDLLSLYGSILGPEVEPAQTAPSHLRIEHNQDMAIVKAVAERLGPASNPPPSEFLSRLRGQPSIQTVAEQPLSDQQRIIAGLERYATGLESLIPAQDANALPVGIMTKGEAESLIRVCMNAYDGHAAEAALKALRRARVDFDESLADDVLAMYAHAGDVASVEHYLVSNLTTVPSEQQRHLHVCAYIHATSPDAIPSSAISVLHSYENQGLPAPMKTYTRVITTLFDRPSSIARAHAWDLFSHMRYVAHPNPDAVLYTLMIRACASPLLSSRASEPERALDLWHEMTVDHNIRPTAGAYAAVILACARAGTQSFVGEAFRLAREMLDSHRDAYGRSAFVPDTRLFCALLEGAKRIGDLARMRWLLAEMARPRLDVDGRPASDVVVNDEVMMHVFHAYTAYEPPFKRADALLVQTTGADDGTTAVQKAKMAPQEAKDNAGVPQTQAEVVREAAHLFGRILRDTGNLAPEHDRFADPPPTKFEHVELTSRLLNAYLSVFYRHSTLPTALDLFRQLYKDDEFGLGVSPNASTFVDALERCASARKGPERELALRFAQEIWEDWTVLEGDHHRPIKARLIERAHVAYVRTMALSGYIAKAVAQLRLFTERYPASAVQTHNPSLATRSTRTALLATDRPVVRSLSRTEIPDDTVPPLLTFKDVEIVHHRLVNLTRSLGPSIRARAAKDIKFLNYTVKAYEWALRNRRNETMKGAGRLPRHRLAQLPQIPQPM